MEQTLSPGLSQPIVTLPSSSIAPKDIDAAFSTSTTDLISAPLQPRILHISNEFFAAASNLLNPTAPISKPGFFVETGAWYDGWETKRHNRNPTDDVIIRIGPAAGVVAGVEIDTAFFTGNHAPAVSVEGVYETGEGADQRAVEKGYAGWKEVLGKQDCEPSKRHAWRVGRGKGGAYEGEEITHVRLRIYPDGGVARFRLYGFARPIWAATAQGGDTEEVELSAAVNGGLATSCSDQHYGKPGNLLLPGRGKDMGDGWETKRSRGEGHVDWAVIRLGARGKVSKVVVDTMHFRGNFPRQIIVALGDFPSEEDDAIGRLQVESSDRGWVEVAEDSDLRPDNEFRYDLTGAGLSDRSWTHAKLTMVPDGGVKRFRIFGTRS